MYYNREISSTFSSLLEENGDLRWLFDYVKNNDELDFLIGKNINNEWISVYRGLSRILTINPYKRSNDIKIHAADAYKNIAKEENLDLYGSNKPSRSFSSELDNIMKVVQNSDRFDRYFKNKKEGYYQNYFSRAYGICGKADDDFVIIDKEAVIGYNDEAEKKYELGKFQKVYKELQKALSKKDFKRFGKNLEKKAIGNELDFLALDNDGFILLIEFKHGDNTSGIYLSPMQIGLYYELFTDLRNQCKSDFDNTVVSMLTQKQKIGLVNPDWKIPENIKGIVPILIISKNNSRSRALSNFKKVLNFVRKEKSDPEFLHHLKIYNYNLNDGLELMTLKKN